ncbi:MAG: hypothetical protein HY363_05610 [Candidatus Aenigmarchaeota archaeon]|nr:hypothetical protein [Candidatus Aenigmarchaeota archaeon]
MTSFNVSLKKSDVQLKYVDQRGNGVVLVKKERDYSICQVCRGKSRDEFTPEAALEVMASFDSAFLKNIRDYSLATYYEMTAQGEVVEYLNPETGLDIIQQGELSVFSAQLVSYGAYLANAWLMKNIHDTHLQQCSVPLEQTDKYAYRVKDGVLAVGYSDNIQNRGPGIFFESKRGRIQKHDRICLQNIMRGIISMNRNIDLKDTNYQFRNFSAKFIVKK